MNDFAFQSTIRYELRNKRQSPYSSLRRKPFIKPKCTNYLVEKMKVAVEEEREREDKFFLIREKRIGRKREPDNERKGEKK